MASSSAQHRCVFVGNIPYDATEEQLIEICREVGPVVSFRLVIDRETGRPKGYGFCEYKDEETALSARRNLQGYEINGRQLRVDFAENDKNADRNREQGRGGPGLAANSDSQKQIGGPAILSESAQHQPIGLHIAITAASIMSGALGGLQSAMQASSNGQPVPANDPLTLHLAKMSRSQLNGIISDLKVMATQNRELARQLLLAKPQLSKALFQAQIMLGMVSQQVLQMPNIWQAPSQAAPPLFQDAQLVQRPAVQTLPGLPPLVHKVPQGPLSSLPQNSLVQNQYSATAQSPLQQQTQISQHASSHMPKATQPGQSGVPPLPSLNSSVRRQIQVANSSLNQQMQQPSLIHHSAQSGAANFGQNSLKILPNTAIQSTLLSHPFTTDTTFQSGPPETSGISDAVIRDADSKAQPLEDSTLSRRSNAYLNLQTSTLPDPKEMVTRPSKLLKVDDGRNTSSTMGILNVSRTSGSGPYQTFASGSRPVNPLPKPEELQHSEKQNSQVQLPSDVESALLQQVLSLTPEQLSSLPPDQRQQVIQLQNALRRDQIQPS